LSVRSALVQQPQELAIERIDSDAMLSDIALAFLGGHEPLRSRNGRESPMLLFGAVLTVFVSFDHALQARQLFAFGQIDERDALGRAAHFPYGFDARANQDATVGDQHDLV